MDIKDPRFQKVMRFVLKWEGGNVDDPDDPGGRTSRGITQSTYDKYRRQKFMPKRDVFEMTDLECREIYYSMYWVPSRAVYIQHYPLALAVMDTAVNFGVGRSKEFLLDACGLDDFGPEATEKIHDKEIAQDLFEHIAVLRIKHRVNRVKEAPRQIKFLRGWINRDTALLLDGLNN